MKKILNQAADFVNEMLDGLLLAHPDMLAYAGDDPHCIVRADAPVTDKVALATGGGSGHLPVFLGYVGKGMLDGCAVGDVFASPSSDQMYELTKRISSGKGVVYIYGNYGGDVMNFEMAAEMAAMDDIELRTVLVKDDVASAPRAEAARRRGVSGMVFAFKGAGAVAETAPPASDSAATDRRFAGFVAYAPALEVYRALLAEDIQFPHIDAVLYHVGMILSEAGEPAGADTLRRLVADHPASPFVQNVVAQKRESERVHLTMRGRVFTRNDAERAHKRVIETREEWLALMRDVFGIDEKEMAGLWPAICHRHDELFPNGV